MSSLLWQAVMEGLCEFKGHNSRRVEEVYRSELLSIVKYECRRCGYVSYVNSVGPIRFAVTEEAM